jgi:hypothetical protein
MIRPEDYAASNTEHAHQVAVFMWASIAKRMLTQLEWLYAIPNGGLRDKRVAGRLKSEGVKKGVSDFFLPWPMMNDEGTALASCGLYVELKRIKSNAKETGIARTKGIESADQEKFQAYARDHFYSAVTCYGWKEAVYQICYYLKVDFQTVNAFVEAEYERVKK